MGKKFTEAISITLINKAVLLKVLKSSGFGQVSGLLIVAVLILTFLKPVLKYYCFLSGPSNFERPHLDSDNVNSQV